MSAGNRGTDQALLKRALVAPSARRTAVFLFSRHGGERSAPSMDGDRWDLQTKSVHGDFSGSNASALETSIAVFLLGCPEWG